MLWFPRWLTTKTKVERAVDFAEKVMMGVLMLVGGTCVAAVAVMLMPLWVPVALAIVVYERSTGKEFAP